MTTSDDIRREIFAAAEELTAASAVLDELLGRQAAYRSGWDRLTGRAPVPEKLVAELSEVRSISDISPEVRAEALQWSMAESPAETAYWQKRRSSDFAAERERFRSAWDRLFTPEFETAVTRLQSGDDSGTEYVIAFIEADPWCYHSGYKKQKYARYLRRVHLTAPQRERLRTAVLDAFTKGRREDLSEYVSLARILDTPEFRDALRRLESGADEGTSERAARALAACLMNDLPGQDRRGGA